MTSTSNLGVLWGHQEGQGILLRLQDLATGQVLPLPRQELLHGVGDD